MNAVHLYDLLVSQSTHLAVLFFVIWGLVGLCRRQSAHLRYLLWAVILVKCLVPPMLTIPVAVLPEKGTPVVEQVASVNGGVTTTRPQAEPADVIGQETILTPPPVASGGPISEPDSIQASSMQDGLGSQRPRILQWIVYTWIAGMGMLFLGTFIRAVRFAGRLKRSRLPLEPSLRQQIDSLAETFRPGLNVKAYQLEGISQPFVWGMMRGTIYLPANFARTGTDDTRLSVLLHEMAHVVRLDSLVNVIQILFQGLYWFHPLVWITNQKIRAEREKCCDEMAIIRQNTSPKAYGSAIVETLVHEYESRMAVPSLAVAGPVKNIEDRIKTIMKPGKQFHSRPTLKMLAAAFMLAMVTIPTAIALTQRTHEAEATSDGKTNPMPERGVWTEILIPDIDESESPAILVLDTHELIQIQDDSDPAAFQQWIDKMQQISAKSFLVYDHASNKGALIMVQGLQFLGIQAGRPGPQEPITRFINNDLPEQFSMTSSEGQVYDFSVLKADSQGCSLRYRPVDKRSGPVQPPVRSKPVQNPGKTLQSLFMASGMLCQSIQEAIQADDFDTALVLCEQGEKNVVQGLAIADQVSEGPMFKALATQFRLWHDVIKTRDKARALKIGEMLNDMGSHMAWQVEQMVQEDQGAPQDQGDSTSVTVLSDQDRRELERLMAVYARVAFSNKLEGAEEIFDFRDTQEKQRVLDMIRKENGQLYRKRDETLPVYVVQIEPMTNSKVMLSALCPLGGPYMGHTVSWVHTDGGWKVAMDLTEMMKMQDQARTMGAEAFGRQQLKTQLERWENAHGPALVSLYEDAKKQLQRQRLMGQYAALKHLDMPVGFKEEDIQRYLDSLDAKTPEEYRTDRIYQLRRQLDPADQNGRSEFRIVGPADQYGKLAFRILPNAAASGRLPSQMTEAEEQKLREYFKDNGPANASVQGQASLWLPLRSGLNLQDAVVEEYQGQQYVLVSNEPNQIMTADGSWGLVAVSPQGDAMGRRAIGLELDQPGGEKLRQITSQNIDQAMAIVVDGQVLSAPTIKAAVGQHVVITGQFTEQEIRDMMVSLRKGMRVKSTATPSEAFWKYWGTKLRSWF